ncbi:flippase [Methanosarcina sp. KYL-1]|uniref:flippase n=1 Tax=Methanosarcina sp. KYL-1 TaxID=2602068 RepID=UPI002100A434|nr:flippase [Methanosarcina sp. KYL-1]MCQ1536893.1 flippase [Methanosarcina sp. KYL-1]
MIDIQSIRFKRTDLFKNKMFKETMWSFATKGMAFGLYFMLNIYLARNLGVEKFGTWSLFFSILSIILLISYFGINASAMKFIAQYNNTDKLYSVLKSSFKIRIVLSFGFTLLFFLTYKPLLTFIDRQDLEFLLLISTPLIFLCGLVEFLKSVFIGLHRVKYNFIITSLEYGLKFGIVVLYTNLAMSFTGIINSYLIATFITSLFGIFILYNNFFLHTSNKTDYNLSTEIFRYGIPLFFVSIGFLVATEIDTIMLGLLSTDGEVGVYAVAKQIVIKIPQISMAIEMGTMPIFAKLNQDNKKNLKRIFDKLVRANAAVMFFIIIGLLMFSGILIPLIFGPEYTGSILPLRILTLYLGCVSICVFFNSFLNYQGLAKKRAINFSIAIVLNIILNYLLIPSYGAVGASIATSISYIPYFVLNWIEVNRVWAHY